MNEIKKEKRKLKKKDCQKKDWKISRDLCDHCALLFQVLGPSRVAEGNLRHYNIKHTKI